MTLLEEILIEFKITDKLVENLTFPLKKFKIKKSLIN